MENETKRLEILIVEDNTLHQEAARELLKEHNVQIVGNFDEAMDYLVGGSIYSPNQGNKKRYDVVLTDLFFPQGRGDCQADRSSASKEMPFGYAVALAAVNEGVQYVGVVSDGNHHQDPMAYTLDFFKKGVVDMGKSRMAIINSYSIDRAYKTLDGRFGTEKEIKEKVEIDITDRPFSREGAVERDGRFYRTEFEVPDGAEDVKNWKASLNQVMNGEIYVPEMPE